MQKDMHCLYEELKDDGKINEKISPIDGEKYTELSELEHDYLAMLKAIIDMLDGAKYLWDK